MDDTGINITVISIVSKQRSNSYASMSRNDQSMEKMRGVYFSTQDFCSVQICFSLLSYTFIVK